MSIRERLARANWELTMLCKNGRVPRYNYGTQMAYPNQMQHGTQMAYPNQMQHRTQMTQQTPRNSAIQSSKTQCGKCGTEVSTLAAFCHICANRIK